MKEKEILWVSKPTFQIGNYKVVINDSVSMPFYTALKKLLETIKEAHSDNNIVLKRFVCHIAVDFFLPVQVLICICSNEDLAV